MFSEEEAKEYYIEYIEDYCNVIFERDNLPAGVRLALNHLMSVDPHDVMIGSQKLHDMSITYHDPSIFEERIEALLTPYARPHIVSNKKKRRYRDGR